MRVMTEALRRSQMQEQRPSPTLQRERRRGVHLSVGHGACACVHVSQQHAPLPHRSLPCAALALVRCRSGMSRAAAWIGCGKSACAAALLPAEAEGGGIRTSRCGATLQRHDEGVAEACVAATAPPVSSISMQRSSV
jgi:hypothetical protein